MSNKTQLQENNTKLNTILSNALGLPTQESMKNGKYVWKKFEYIPEKTITSGSVKITTTSNIAKLTESTIDFTAANTDVTSQDCFLLNLASSDTNSSGQPNVRFTYSTSGYISIGLSIDSYKVTSIDNITPTSCDLRISGSIISGVTNKEIKLTKPLVLSAHIGMELGYVVADNENAYPDKAVHSDGFYYEKWVENNDISFGWVTKSTSFAEITVEHNLNEAPSKAYLLPISVSNSTTDYAIGLLTGKTPIYSYGSSHFYEYNMRMNSFTRSTKDYKVSVLDNKKIVFKGSVMIQKGSYLWIAIT